MRVRYTEGDDEMEVAPVDHPSFVAKRLEWVDVDKDVALQLHRQGWELESVKKAAKTRAAGEGDS